MHYQTLQDIPSHETIFRKRNNHQPKIAKKYVHSFMQKNPPKDGY